GTAHAVPGGAEGYRFERRLTLAGGLRLCRLQWRIARFLQQVFAHGGVPAERDAALAESLALGLCLQALLQRLDSNARRHMAQWLADPSSAPLWHRRTFRQLQAIQLR